MTAAPVHEAQTVLLGTNPLPRLGQPANLTKAREVARDFEAVFLAEMLKPIFESVKISETFGGGGAEDIWRSQQVAEYGKALARKGGIGIADAVLRQMLKSQEIG